MACSSCKHLATTLIKWAPGSCRRSSTPRAVHGPFCHTPSCDLCCCNCRCCSGGHAAHDARAVTSTAAALRQGSHDWVQRRRERTGAVEWPQRLSRLVRKQPIIDANNMITD